MSAAARRTLAPLAVVTAAAFVFALLLVLVRLQWAPLESADHGALGSIVCSGALFLVFLPATRDRGPWARSPRRPPASRTGDNHAT